MDVLVKLVENQVFSGLVGGSLVMTVLYALRKVPETAWQWATWRFTCSLTIFSEDAAFERVNEWLASIEYARRCRRLRLITTYDDTGEGNEVLAPGIGSHLFWYRGRPLMVRRHLPEKGGIGGYKRFEDITIETLGSSSSVLHHLVEEIKETRRKMHGKSIDVYLYRNRWRLACRKAKRPLETVVLPAEQKEALVRDVQDFIGARAWYAARGIPYRRGYLFEGPPGCGKTSVSLALASHFARPVYALNLGSIAGDDELIDAVSEVPEHGILLIEDIDVAKAVVTRKPVETAPVPARAGEAPKEERREVSLSGLLNALDGVFSREGRILIMTTNHPERVDPALLRHGRVDRCEHIGPLRFEDALVMCRRFLDEREAEQVATQACVKHVGAPTISAAALQEELVQRAHAQRREHGVHVS